MSRGRPKGSKNKKRGLGRDSLISLFKASKFEPGEFLLAIANGEDTTEPWDRKDRMKAAQILMAHTYDKPGRETEQQLIEELRKQQQIEAPVYEIVYVEDQTSFTLPTKAGAKMAG